MMAGEVAGVGCNSVLGSGWRRVGVMASQYMNGPKTCETSGNFQLCRPPNTPNMMCGMPWEKRFGLPNNIDNADLVCGRALLKTWPCGILFALVLCPL